MSKNNDPLCPWNREPYKDDPSQPWNSDGYKDDQSAPWNNEYASNYDWEVMSEHILVDKEKAVGELIEATDDYYSDIFKSIIFKSILTSCAVPVPKDAEEVVKKIIQHYWYKTDSPKTIRKNQAALIQSYAAAQTADLKAENERLRKVASEYDLLRNTVGLLVQGDYKLAHQALGGQDARPNDLAAMIEILKKRCRELEAENEELWGFIEETQLTTAAFCRRKLKGGERES